MRNFTQPLALVLLACGQLAAAGDTFSSTPCSASSATSFTSIPSMTTLNSTCSSTVSSSSGAVSTAIATVGIDTNGLVFTYPYPVQLYNFTSQRAALQMAYMDVSPPSGTALKGVALLLHGKFFCGATWNTTISFLSSYGYRVLIPDQLGFCKSSKPLAYQFSLSQLALNTNALLQSLNITSATVMGHSMGGMLAVRYSLMFPSQVSNLVMIDPLGLENWFAKGTPYQSIDASYKTELATTFASIKTYENATYYSGRWNPSYDIWVTMLLNVYQGSQGSQFAYNMAQTTDMVFTQPILQELRNLSALRSLLVVGDNDNTAVGKAWAPAWLRPLLGNYKVLGKEASKKIGPNNTLVEFENLGHAPHIEDPEAFFGVLVEWLP